MAKPLFDGNSIVASSFIRHVEIHDSLGSTNDRAAEFARDPGIALPVIVIAKRQTAGRGRGKNVWWSADGALTFSVLFDSAALGILVRDWPKLSLSTAVALCDALSGELNETPPQPASFTAVDGTPSDALIFQPEPRLMIKWPNDVMLDHSKVCGVLIEAPAGAGALRNRVIIGIGVNVNNSSREAPGEVAASGIALCDASNRTHNMQEVLLRVLSALERRIKQLAAEDSILPRGWQQLCWLRGKNISVSTGERQIAGVCHGLADDGAVTIETKSRIEYCYDGSVSIDRVGN